MQIKRVPANQHISQITKLIDSTAKNAIKEVNWADEYPGLPNIEFAILHDGDNIYIKYWVAEQATLANITEDFGQVWTDSCVEFFISFGEGYYNLEFNSIGYGLASYRTCRESAENIPTELMRQIERYPSLECKKFDEQSVGTWSLMLKIPKEVFTKENISTFNNISAKANFYKCGDNLSEPHFVSWSKINTPAPNFHQPQYFQEIKFE